MAILNLCAVVPRSSLLLEEGGLGEKIDKTAVCMQNIRLWVLDCVSMVNLP